jgi:hypothetical protein
MREETEHVRWLSLLNEIHFRWLGEKCAGTSHERPTPDPFIAHCLAFAKAIAPGAVALWHDRTPQHL